MNETKKKLLEMAANGDPRPKSWTPLGQDLAAYTNDRQIDVMYAEDLPTECASCADCDTEEFMMGAPCCEHRGGLELCHSMQHPGYLSMRCYKCGNEFALLAVAKRPV